MNQESGPNPHYGELPLDCYLMEQWDFDQPVEADAEQWKNLIRAYLDLSRRERVPYHARTVRFSGDEQPPAELITRCLARFQTAQERSSLFTCNTNTAPPMVRTYYGEDLGIAYASLLQEHAIQVCELNNRALYEGLNTEQILLRLPQLPDQPHIPIIEDAEDIEQFNREGSPPYEGLAKGSFEKAARDGHVILIVADKEAMKEQQLKIKWLDLRGHCVWETRLKPDNLLGFTGLMADGFSLSDFYYEGITNGNSIIMN